MKRDELIDNPYEWDDPRHCAACWRRANHDRLETQMQRHDRIAKWLWQEPDRYPAADDLLSELIDDALPDHEQRTQTLDEALTVVEQRSDEDIVSILRFQEPGLRDLEEGGD